MTGSINNLNKTISQLHENNKKVFVHLEMIAGIGRDKDALRYLFEDFNIDGIISTKSQIISAAKAQKIPCVQRIFAIDTSALQNALQMIESSQPDEVELMPGLMPKVIRQVKDTIKRPLIVGGLIKSPDEVECAFSSGSDYISTGCQELWDL